MRVDDGTVVVVVEGLAGLTEGGVEMVTDDASSEAVGPSLPTASRAALAASRAITVPSDEQLTETVKVVPDDEFGVNVQLVAVPELVKSADVRPDTDSLKARP